MKALTALLLIGISVAAFFFYVYPQYKEIQAYREEARQYDEVLAKAEELKKIRVELASKLNTFSPADLERLSKLIPEKVDDARFILDVSNVAVQNGIEMKNIQVSSVSLGEHKPGNAKPYKASTLTFDFKSTYEGMVGFALDLEQSLRLLDIVNIHLAPGDGKTPVFTYTITLQTYWLNNEPATAAKE